MKRISSTSSIQTVKTPNTKPAMKTTALKILCGSLLTFASLQHSGAGPFLIDLSFDGSDAPTGKTGFAATGNSSTDYWNWYTRNDGHGGLRTLGTLSNLLLADGTTATSVGMTIQNADGSWFNGSPDPMYYAYLYPLYYVYGPNVTVTFSSLPAGRYDLYAYTYDGNTQLSVGGLSYGVQYTFDPSPSSPVVWTQGRQYSKFEIDVAAGQNVVVTEMPGQYGYAVISGFQIQAVPEPATGALLVGGLIAASLVRRTGKKHGKAAC
jgi:hypothetical protein